MDNGASSYRRFRDNGDQNALVEIIRDYKDGLILYLTSIVGNVQTAEELAEDTFVLIGTKKPKDKGKSSFKTWLYTIGRNVAIDYLRKHSKYIEVSMDDNNADFISDEDVVESAYIKKEQKILMMMYIPRKKMLMCDYFALRKAANRLKESASTRRGKQ